MESVATIGGTRTLRGQHNRVKLKLITILSVLVCQETQLQAASILDCWWTHHHYEAGTKGRCKELASFLRPKHQVMARHRCTGPNLPHPVSAIGLNITLLPVNTVFWLFRINIIYQTMEEMVRKHSEVGQTRTRVGGRGQSETLKVSHCTTLCCI